MLPYESEERKVVERYSAETDENYGVNPYKRKISDLLKYGVINLDKPEGPTSHAVADTVKKLLNVKVCGHGGTLDPRVTGVLPIGLNKASKVLQVFLYGGKEYVCEMKVHKDISKEEILRCFNHFTGKIRQLPPIKSSVKRQWRTREIYYIELIEMQGRSVLFRVGCEAGTYIRKLCTDMGEYMGTGAHMQNLRRTQASCFKEENSVTLFDIQDAVTLYNEKGDDSLLRKVVLPMEEAVVHLKKVYASDGGVAAVSYGAPLMVPGVSKLTNNIKRGDFVAVMSLKGELVALGEAKMSSQEMMNKKRGVAVAPKRVFMEAGTYPRSWK